MEFPPLPGPAFSHPETFSIHRLFTGFADCFLAQEAFFFNVSD